MVYILLKTYMSEGQRSAHNALAVATNCGVDFDLGVADEIDEVLEFPLPGQEECLKLLKLYFEWCICLLWSL